MQILERLKLWARKLKKEVLALWLAARDQRTARFAKLLALAIAAYALSPIDLIPDFIPVIGFLDDMIILPLGIAWAIQIMPAALMRELREKADRLSKRPSSKTAAIVIIAIWLIAFVAAAVFLFSPLK